MRLYLATCGALMGLRSPRRAFDIKWGQLNVLRTRAEPWRCTGGTEFGSGCRTQGSTANRESASGKNWCGCSNPSPCWCFSPRALKSNHCDPKQRSSHFN